MHFCIFGNIQRSIPMPKLLLTLGALIILTSSCIKEKKVNTEDKFLLVTNAASKSHVSTLNHLNDFSTNRNLSFASSPTVRPMWEDLFILEPGDDTIRRYHRFSNGDITETGVLSLLPASGASDIITLGERQAYCSLKGSAKILCWDPGAMSKLEFIDISVFGISDADPDATIMAFSNGKLFVVCNQEYTGKTIPSPAQVLIIDTKNGNTVTSVTDDRGAYKGYTPSSAFFTENGDFYLYCGAAKPEQNGFLRIKNGQSSFDVDYFFNLSTVNYLECPFYAGNNLLFSMGAIPGSQQFGAFKINVINKTVEKIDLPYSNSYAGNILRYRNNLYFGISTATVKGFYEYEIASGKAAAYPRVNTTNLGDPWFMSTFIQK